MRTELRNNIDALSAFAALRGLSHPFVISGGVGGSRFSYAGAEPFALLRTEAGGRTTVAGEAPPDIDLADPFGAVSDLLAGHRTAEIDTGAPFSGGAAGYFSYDLKRFTDAHAHAFKDDGSDTWLPECMAGLYDPVFVFDHESGRGFLQGSGTPGAAERAGRIRKLLEEAPRMQGPGKVAPGGAYRSNFTKEAYMEAIRKAQEYIASGDIYQINLSQKLVIPWEVDPFTLYRRLVETSPSLFSSFFDYGEFQVISNSPERLLKVSGGWAETSPIKGTRPRGATSELDTKLVAELVASEKERAEHVMIVDLERNDLGRVCEPGTVRVTAFETVETLPGLHHMVSTIRGKVKPGTGPLECLKSAFPGGSITGAPKIRAMEIIDELEPDRRGIYTGGIGWIGFNGEMDISMAIRTAVYRAGELSLSVGGGIVADSVAEDEYDETILKAKSFLDLAGLESVPSGGLARKR